MLPTYCNPLSIEDMPDGREIDFKSSGRSTEGVSDYRSISDPSVVYHDGKWILYPSYGIAYVSEDFVHWRHVDVGVPHVRYSPAIVQFRGKWYLQGHAMGELYRADSPTGKFELCGYMTDAKGNPVRPCDACFLADGERLYMYYFGMREPREGEDVEMMSGTLGVELDPDEPWRFLHEPVFLNAFDPSCEWQRHGEYNQNERIGWIEGQWAIKRGDRYYILYSGSGTQFSTYACGVIYSDEGPLSGFRRQTRHDPLLINRTGLVRGAGHGSIVEGPGDTLWFFYTNPMPYGYSYERRISMDPLGIDDDGEIFCPGASETPQYAPGVLPHPEEGNSVGLLPLTFMQRPTASSAAPGRDAIYAVDESLITWWQPSDTDPEPTIEIPLGGKTDFNVSALRLIWRDVGMEIDEGILPGAFRYVLEYRSSEDSTWRTAVDASDNSRDLSVDYRTFETVLANSVRLRIVGAPTGITPALVSITAFGKCAHKTQK